MQNFRMIASILLGGTGLSRARVLLNDLAAHRPKSGVGHYVAELIRHFPKDPEIELVPLTQTTLGRSVNFLNRSLARSRPSNIQNKQMSWIGKLKSFAHSSVDGLSPVFTVGNWSLYHEPDAIALNVAAPTITTFQDLSVLLFPDWHPLHRVARYERRLRAGIARTDLFLAISMRTKEDMVRVLGIAPELIEVIPLAPRPAFRKIDSVTVERVTRRLSLPQQYLLFTGTIEPRKNVAGLLRAYSRLPTATKQRVPLVLVGGWGWKSEDVAHLLEESSLKGYVRWLGYLSDDDLVAVMNGSLGLVYPSHYEGFGLPPLEAMACGKPVIAANAGSLPEVLGNAASLIESHDDDELRNRLQRLIDDDTWRADLIRRGTEQVQKYDWQMTASRTWDVYRQTLGLLPRMIEPGASETKAA